MCSEAQGRVNLYDENMSLMQSCWSNAICAVFRVTLFLWATFLPAFPSPVMAQAALDSVEVPYLTLRNRTDAEEPGEVFGEARSTLKAGRCRVSDRDLRMLSPLADSAPSYLRDELLEVREVTHLRPAVLLDQLQTSVPADGLSLYVHGYKIGFDKGCRRAVLLKDNAELSGRMLWFSWPSDGTLSNYVSDEADLYWSVPDLADSIVDLQQRFGAEPVNVVAHSLGARGVVLALADVASRFPEMRLGQVVLVAADMDFAIFERVLPRIESLAENITVYVSDSDRPLAVSRQLHGYPRLGEAGNDVAALAGVEVIDVSGLPSSSPTGHLYHIYSRTVGEDLSQILNEGMRASGRRKLVRAGRNLWTLVAGSSDQPEE